MKIMSGQWRKKIMTVCAAATAAVMVMGYSLPVQAADSYKVSFKVGSRGSFRSDVSGVSESRTSVTRNYQYKEVIGEEELGSIGTGIEVEAGYYFTGWSPKVEPVTRKANYVAQYARIIHEAVYRVNYVDTYGNAVATQKVAATELGQSVTEQAPSISGYTVDVQTQTAQVSKANGTEITFTYTQEANVVTETETVIVPGETTVTTVTEPGTTGQPGATTGGAAGTGTAEGTPATPETEGPDTVVDEDEEVPLAEPDAEEEQEGETVRSEDEDVPLANEDVSSGKVMTYVIAIGMLIVAAATATYVYKKRKN